MGKTTKKGTSGIKNPFRKNKAARIENKKFIRLVQLGEDPDELVMYEDDNRGQGEVDNE